jgi:hypothetical protein
MGEKDHGKPGYERRLSVRRGFKMNFTGYNHGCRYLPLDEIDCRVAATPHLPKNGADVGHPEATSSVEAL